MSPGTGGHPGNHGAGHYLPPLADQPPAGSTAGAPTFSSVVLDVDSTVCGIEGIDWLAARRPAAIAAEIEELTAQAMDGRLALDQVYGKRLALVQPTESEVQELSEEYLRALAPGAVEGITRLREAGVRVVLISGGLRQAILPVAAMLGFTQAEVYAVRAMFDGNGEYAGFDEASPLASQEGKARVVQRLYLPRPLLAVGDGSTDLAMRPAADAFAAFTGFVRRPAVAAAADHEIRSFAQLTSLILP